MDVPKHRTATEARVAHVETERDSIASELAEARREIEQLRLQKTGLEAMLCDGQAEIGDLKHDIARLRAALAQSKDACIYCQLPADEMAKCKSGFPGCARADDSMGCPEFGAAMRAMDLERAMLATADQLHTLSMATEGHLRGQICTASNRLDKALGRQQSTHGEKF